MAIGGGASIVGSVYSIVLGFIRAYKLYHEALGQRLANEGLKITNRRQQLELEALTITLTEDERRRVAEQLTGLPLGDPSVEGFRAHVQDWARSKALEELQEQIEELKDQVEESERQLAEVSCPFCRAPISERRYDDGRDGTEHSYESFECGYAMTNDYTSSFCRNDPDPPTIDDYELATRESQSRNVAGKLIWMCYPSGKNRRGKKIRLRPQYSDSEERVREKAEQDLDHIVNWWRRRVPGL